MLTFFSSLITTLGLPIFGTYNLTAGWLGLIFGLTTFLCYLRSVYCENGILKSISISYYYVHPHWLFQQFMWTSILCILLMGQTWWYVVVAFLFGIMTCNPTVNGGNIYFIPHMIGAISAIVLANLGLGIYFGLWWLVILLAAILVSIVLISSFRNQEQCPDFNKTNKLYWIEVASIFSLIVGLFIGCLL